MLRGPLKQIKQMHPAPLKVMGYKKRKEGRT